METGATDLFDHGETKAAHESVFAPRPASAGGTGAEDDGWLLSYVYDQATEKSEVLILDASTMSDQPVARILLPNRVPMGFHGNWVPLS